MRMLGGVVAALVTSMITYWLLRRLTRHVSIPFDEYITKRAEAAWSTVHSPRPPRRSSRASISRIGAPHARVLLRGTTTHSRGHAFQDIVRVGRTASFQFRISLN
jgi:hypothetical protein